MSFIMSEILCNGPKNWNNLEILYGKHIIFMKKRENVIIVDRKLLFIFQAPVVQTLDSAIHRINHYPADSVIDFRNTYQLDSDLSGG